MSAEKQKAGGSVITIMNSKTDLFLRVKGNMTGNEKNGRPNMAKILILMLPALNVLPAPDPSGYTASPCFVHSEIADVKP